MDGLALLAEARAAGLSVAAAGDQLRVWGPRSAAPLAERLLAAKIAVLEALNAPRVTVDPTAVWWDDHVPGGSSAIRYVPPRECIGPRVCSRVGVCDRHASGAPCLIAPATGEPTIT